MIDICLEYKDDQFDYRVPTEVTFGRFIELMRETLKDKPTLPENWELQIRDKAFKIDESDLLSDLPIGNGDIFSIIPLEENEI